MLTKRPASERGRYQNDWLDSRHTFSFGEYYDPRHLGVSILRVINDDRVIAGAGFATHPHKNMEIISYVLSGELAHEDSMGNGSTIRAGDVQRMSAGTGVTHSEFNPSNSVGMHFLQIWLLPNRQNIPPSYEQKNFSIEEKQGQFKLLVSPDGRDGSITAVTDGLMYGCVLSSRQQVQFYPAEDRVIYLHVARGDVAINEYRLTDGDGATVTEETAIAIEAHDESEILLFDLPFQPHSQSYCSFPNENCGEFVGNLEGNLDTQGFDIEGGNEGNLDTQGFDIEGGK